MCLYLLWSGFSVGLRLAKTTEVRTALLYRSLPSSLRSLRCFLYRSLPSSLRSLRCSLYRSLPSSLLASDHSLLRSSLPLGLSACTQASRRLPPPLAYRELYERQGETVRKLDHKYCHIAVRLCFQTRVCACTYLRGEFLGRSAPCQDNGGLG